MRFLAELISLTARLFMAYVLLSASLDKVWEPAAFADSVARYDLLPLWAVNGFSVVLAWLEMVLGGLLLLGIALRPAALWASGLMALFTGLMIWAGFSGAGFDCGCFPGGASHAAGFEAALRDLGYLLPSLWLLAYPGYWLNFRRRPRPDLLGDY